MSAVDPLDELPDEPLDPLELVPEWTCRWTSLNWTRTAARAGRRVAGPGQDDGDHAGHGHARQRHGRGRRVQPTPALLALGDGTRDLPRSPRGQYRQSVHVTSVTRPAVSAVVEVSANVLSARASGEPAAGCCVTARNCQYLAMRNDASPHASGTGALRAARDLLLAHRTEYAAAVARFAWPELDEFNWALDWFDVIAAEHPDRLALRVVGDDGSDEAVSYAAMAARSAQVANWLRGLGVRRGDHVLLMLGNIVPLWEIMLAAMKLGAVDDPRLDAAAAGRPGGPDLAGPRAARDRRGGAHRRSSPRSPATGPASSSAATPVDRLRPRAGGRTRTPLRAPAEFTPGRGDPGERPAAALLHLGHDVAAQAGRAHPGQLPGRPPVHDVLDRHPAGRRAPEHLLTRLGQARLVEPLRPVERAGHDPHTQPVAGSAPRAAAGARRLRRDHVLRAADRVADAHPGRPVRPRTSAGCASASRRASRSTRRSSSRSARPGGSPCGTASARPRRPRRSATRRASRSSPGRWAGRCPATRSCSSTR